MGFYGSRIPPYAERIPFASAIVYREGDYAIAKVWNEQWGRWSRIAKSTDHASVIQSAIDSAPTRGTILLNGRFDITKSITAVNKKITGGEIRVADGIDAFILGDYTDVSNMKITALGSSPGNALYLYGINIRVTNIRAFNYPGTLMYIYGGDTPGLYPSTFHEIRNIYADRVDTGIHIYRPPDAPGSLSTLISDIRILANTCALKIENVNDIYARNIDLIGLSSAPAVVSINNASVVQLEGAITGFGGETAVNIESGLHIFIDAYVGGVGTGIKLNAKASCIKGLIMGNNVCGINILADADRIVISDCIIRDNPGDGIKFETTSEYRRVTIENSIIFASGSGAYEIVVPDSYWNVLITGCVLSGTSSSALLNLPPTNNVIIYNTILEHPSALWTNKPQIVKVHWKKKTVNSGIATIPAGSTKVTVNHDLVSKPSKIFVTPLSDPGDRYYVTNITDTSFDIVIATAPSSDVTFAWYAEV